MWLHGVGRRDEMGLSMGESWVGNGSEVGSRGAEGDKGVWSKYQHESPIARNQQS